jgi:hypothetical protein
MADWDEEIRRQKAISALLEAPEAQAQSDQNPPSLDTQVDEQVVAPDTTIPKHVEEHYGNWRDWPSISPPAPLNIPTPTPESPSGPVNVKTDPDTGTPYVEDQGVKIPRAELATPAEKEAFKSSDVTLPREISVGEAPAPRVERGEELTEPWHPADKPLQIPVPTPESPSWPEVRRAQPVTYPTVAEDQGAPGTPPKVERAQPVDFVAKDSSQQNQPVQTQAPEKPAVQPTGDWRTWTTTDGTPADPTFKPSEKPAPQTGDAGPMLYAPNGQAPAALIIHHTSGRNSAESVVDDWRTNRPGVGAQMIMDRDGTIHDTQKEFGYNGTGNFLHSVIPGVSNQTAVGIEVIAKDDADMTDAQIESLKRLAGPTGAYANVPVYGHSQVSPGDRDNEGVRGVNAIMEARKAGGGEAGDTLAQLQSSGLNVTTYGQKDDPYGDKDSAAGRGAYVSQLVPGYDVALNAAAAKLVGNPQPGQEFTYAGRTFRYGDKVPENYSDARFDVFDPYNTALSALGKGTAAVAPKKQDWESWATLSPEAVTSAVTAANKTDIQKLQDNLQGSGNLIQFYKDLNTSPPKGISPEAVGSFKASLQKVITQQMQERFPDMTTDVAWKKAQEDSSLWDIGSEFWHQGQASFAQLAPVFAQKSPDREQVNAFFDNVMPGASDADKQAFLAKVHSMPREQQGPFIASQLPAPQAGQRGNDPMAVLTAIDHLSDPDFLKKESDKLAAAREFAAKAATEDPRLKGSAGEDIAGLGAIPEQLMAYYGIPIIGAAQASEQTRARMAKEHPDWDEQTLDEKSAYSTLAQVVGNTAATTLMAHGAGALLKTITSPWKRAIGQVVGGALTNMGINVGTTAATNIAEGRAPETGLGEAARAGAIQGGLIGGVHGAGELMPRPAVPEAAPQAEVPLPPVPERRQPVSGADITGPDVPDTSMPWYKPGPVITRGTERTTFTPSELAEGAQTVTGRTPEELQVSAENLRPPTDFNQRQVFLDSAEAQQAEIQRAQAVQAQQAEIENSHVAGALHKEGTLSTGVAGESEPWVSKIANRFTAERMVAGDLGHVEPGLGVTKEEMLARGLKMGPEEINQHVSDVMSNRGGDPKQQAAAIRAEEARLAQRSHNASLISEADPQNQQARIEADNAFKDLTDFHNGPVAKLKNNWHAQGMTLQGEIPVDLSTYNGLREAFLRDVGKPPPAEMEPVLRNTAKRVRDASMAEAAAMQKLGAEVERQSARRLLPTDEQVREKIMKRMKVEPCPI